MAKIEVSSSTFWVQMGIAVELHDEVDTEFEICVSVSSLLLLLLSLSEPTQPKMHPRSLPPNRGSGSPGGGRGGGMFKGKPIGRSGNDQNHTKSHIKLLDYNVGKQLTFRINIAHRRYFCVGFHNTELRSSCGCDIC